MKLSGLRFLLTSIIICFQCFSLFSQQEIRYDFVSIDKFIAQSTYHTTVKLAIYNEVGNRIYTNSIRPYQTLTIPFKFNYSKAKKLRFQVSYDKDSYEIDLERVQIAKERLRRQKIHDAYIRAFWAGVDELITGGFFNKVRSGLGYANMVFNGATQEEWREKILKTLVSAGVDSETNSRIANAIVSATFELADSMSEPDYSSLRNYMKNCLTSLTEGFSNDGLVSEFATMPVKKKFPNLSIDFAYPIKQRYGEDMSDVKGNFLVGSNDIFPFQVSLNFYTSEKFGLFAQYSKTLLFKNNNNQSLESVEDNASISFDLISFGLRIRPSYLELGLGATYIKQSILLNSGGKEQRKSFGGIFEPRIIIDLNENVSLYAGWRSIIFKENTKTKGLFQLINQYNIGMNIKFLKYKYHFQKS